MATKKHKDETAKELRNEDPISGEAGAHPVGTGMGAAIGGAATGAVAGAFAGPVGTAAGAVVGAIAGGLAGKSVAESVDPTVELEYWRNEYPERPYYDDAYDFADFEPAYRAGVEAYETDGGVNWTEREAIARRKWEQQKRTSDMTWEQARLAAQDAYTRASSRPRKPR